ncbi:MAG: delta-60 repeat domain-containing protein [Verrucomicrobia bacterium]|nr:delta-60 repeat domain-containing protein [Verrucomicrobiota bacterium]
MKARTSPRFIALVFTAVILLLCGITPLRAQSIPTLDPNFRPVITRLGGSVSAVAVQPDGKLILAGAFNAINGIGRNGLARVNPDGTVDLTFDAGAGTCCSSAITQTQIAGPISALAVQTDGKLLIGGSFESVNGTPHKGLARLNANGTLDTSFNSGAGLDAGQGSLPVGMVSAIVVQPDGKVLIGGSFIAVGGVKHVGIARLEANGSVDVTFNTDPVATDDQGTPGQVLAVALLKNGQVLIGGNFSLLDITGRAGMARLSATGGLDNTFVPGIFQLDTTLPPPVVDGLVVQPDGKIVFSGSFEYVDSDSRTNVTRINSDATLDSTFNPIINPTHADTFRVLGLQADGKVIGYRQFSDANGFSQSVIARLNNDGSLDPAFSLTLRPGLPGGLQVRGAALQLDGRWLIVGNFTADTDVTPRGIARLNSSGGLDSPFNPQLELSEGSVAHVQAVAVQKDGKIVIGGTFNRINGTQRGQLARFNHDGTLDTSFVPLIEPADPKHSVAAIAIQGDGKILIGGWFETVNGHDRNGVARLNDDGSLDDSFDIGTGTSELNGTIGRVLAIAVQADGKIILGGDFAVFNGQGAPWVVRLNPNGSLDTALASGLNCLNCNTSEINALATLKSGHIMISGVFDRISGSSYNGLARLLPDGSVDPKFISPVAADEETDALAVASDDKTIIAVLSFDPAGGVNRTRLVRLDTNGVSEAIFQAGVILSDGSSAAPVSAIEIDDEGRINIAGAFTSVAGTPRRDLARLKPDGTLDTGFDAGTGFANGVFNAASNVRSRVTRIDRQDDGGIIVGGNFSVANGQVRLGLARFQAEPPSQSGGSRPVIHSPARTGDGTFSMTVSGEVGRAYRVEASTDLQSWSAIGNITGAPAPQPFSDAGSKNLPYRFYRVVAGSQ